MGDRSWRPGTGRVVLATALALTLGGACAGPATSDEQRVDGTGPATAERSDTSASASATSCDRAVAPPVEASPVDGTPSDVDLTSFDGTRLRVHWFPHPEAGPDDPVPTVLMGPGWSLAGDTEVDSVGVFGALNITTLHDAGFNVLTWDPRGFGASDGTAMVNSPDHEGRDVQVLLDWIAVQPTAQLDGAGDPRAGMVGGSYGGGIQLVVAALDCRVDALVPVVAWHSLQTSLYKGETPKAGWAGILVTAAATGSVDPHVTNASASSQATGTISDEDLAWFVTRGPGDLVEQVRVPTLFVHGTVDTLFTLDEAITNYEILRSGDVPTGMVWFCGGHGTCLTEPGEPERVSETAIAWLRRWVLDDASVDTGPRVEVLDQRGTTHPADDWPLPAGPPLTAVGSGTLALAADGGAGPATEVGGTPDLLSSLVLPITPARASNAVEVTVPTDADALVVGAPELTLSYQGTTPAGERPTRVFAQLVDDETGLVVGNQITPIPVTLDGRPHTIDVPLEVVAHDLDAGASLTLQLVATTVAYAEPRLGGTVTFDRIDLRLPTAVR